MSDTDQPTPAQRIIGDFSPKLVQLTDDIVFGDIWARPELAARDRSLITVAALITNGSTEQLRGSPGPGPGQRPDRGRAEGSHHPPGLRRGWPRAMSAVTVAREVFKE